jgi:hypothetical protein
MDQLRLNDRFELKAQAGSGGMGTVYKATDRRNGGLVAVKILNVKSLTDVGRFDQEAAMLRELRHPGIVRYVDHGLTSHGDPYIAMEWLEGETLEQRLARGALPPAGVAHLGGRVLDALAVAHERGIVHRDIKPSNVFLVGWRLFDIRIIDFGVARRVFDPKRFTRRGATVGTPLYTAPEQARGEGNVDGRADIFSLGCVMFECLAGKPPFLGKSPQDVMEKICVGPAPELQEKCKELDVELARLVGRMFAQDRRLRPGSARELGRELRAVAARLGALEDAAVRADGGRPPEALGFSEQRVMAGLVVSFVPPRRIATRVAAGTIVDGVVEDHRRAEDVRTVAAEVGASAESFARGRFILTPPVAGPIADQAREMARAALRLHETFPEARFCLGVGRAMLLAGLPVGDLCDQLTDLLSDLPGTVRLDATAARLLPPRLVVRGPDGEAWLAVAEATRATVAAADAPVPLFLGREREIGGLIDTLAECAEEEVARATVMTAPAGGGKTRLARELVARVRAGSRPAAAYFLRGRQERAATPYGLLAPLFAEAHIETGPEVPAPSLEKALLEWLAGLAATEPVVLVCDDLQWADPASAELLGRALQELRDRPLLVAGFGRPELDVQFPRLWRARDVQRTRLAPLSQKSGAALLRWHLPEATTEAADHVLDRWEGNPFFLAELAEAVRAGSFAVPDSVLGTVEARLFALDEEPRRVLRAASLYGDTFDIEAVLSQLGLKGRAALEENLNVLVERDLVRRIGGEPGGAFAFRQVLVREAAFAMLTAADRAVGVARARQWLAEAGKTLPEFLMAQTGEAAAASPGL